MTLVADSPHEGSLRVDILLVSGVSEATGGWRAQAGSWSIAECLDRLATGNRVYLGPMREAAARARTNQQQRRRPADPGVLGRWFVRWDDRKH